MLRELRINNYAIIESLKLEMADGLNVFTGETGAGKSIIIESVEIILGSRCSSEVIRKGAEKSVVSAVFDINGHSELKQVLQEKGIIDAGNDTLIIRREMDTSGKSKCYCNDEPVTLNLLREIGDMLVDIHGQYDHQVLLKPINQLNFLDRYSGLSSIRAEVSELYGEYQGILEEINSLKLNKSEREHKIDLYKFQLKEIDDVGLKRNEDEEIEGILPQLKNADKLKNLASEACQYILREDNSLLDRLNKVARIYEDIGRITGNIQSNHAELENMISRLKDIAGDLEKFCSRMDVDPKELDKFIDRKDLIIRLKKKYGQSVSDILSYRDKIKSELDKLHNSEENIIDLEKKAKTVEEKLNDLCAKLSSERGKSAGKLEGSVEKVIQELGMEKAGFKIKIDKGMAQEGMPKITATGWDNVEFLFSANAGEDLKPLREIASGGEMSRTMLALKTVLGGADNIPIMIFDEIDYGVGGPMGQVIGEKLAQLSKDHQVFCITHLAQIACFADKHIKVEKEVRSGRTYTVISSLTESEKVEEVARMLSGKEITAVSRKHAKELILQTQ